MTQKRKRKKKTNNLMKPLYINEYSYLYSFVYKKIEITFSFACDEQIQLYLLGNVTFSSIFQFLPFSSFSAPLSHIFLEKKKTKTNIRGKITTKRRSASQKKKIYAKTSEICVLPPFFSDIFFVTALQKIYHCKKYSISVN